MPCFRCPHCGRQYMLGPVDLEEGGHCACGARFVVESRERQDADVSRPVTDDPAGPVTWAVESDGSTYELQFY